LRGLPNAFGIRVKKAPYRTNDAYYSDDPEDMDKIYQDFEDLYTTIGKYKRYVFPSNGIGTGLAELKQRAPVTYQYLKDACHLFGFNQPD